MTLWLMNVSSANQSVHTLDSRVAINQRNSNNCTLYLISVGIFNMCILMPPFEGWGAYCFAHICWSPKSYATDNWRTPILIYFKHDRRYPNCLSSQYVQGQGHYPAIQVLNVSNVTNNWRMLYFADFIIGRLRHINLMQDDPHCTADKTTSMCMIEFLQQITL